MKDIDIKASLAKLIRQMDGLNARVSQMPQMNIQVSARLLPTILALEKLQSANATAVGLVTQRCRAFESKNLNELSMMGFLVKQKVGRERIFSLKTAPQRKRGNQSVLADYHKSDWKEVLTKSH